MSGTPCQNQEFGAPSYTSHYGNITIHNGGIVHGGTLSKVEITNSCTKPNIKQATGRGGVDGKCLDKNDGVAASDGRGEIQTTTRATHTWKDDHGALYIPHDLTTVDLSDITLKRVGKYFEITIDILLQTLM